MSRILLVGDDAPLLHSHSRALGDAGHRVELAPDVFRARDRLSGDACDLVVIDIRSPDGGLGLLIEQARAAWTDCRVVALVHRADIHRSKVHQMGLWTPDLVLVLPISGGELARAIETVIARPAQPRAANRQGAVL